MADQKVDVDSLPGTLAADNAASKGYLQTLASAVISSLMQAVVTRIDLPADWTVVRQSAGNANATQLTASSIPCRSMPIVKAHPANTVTIYIGKSGVTSSSGIPLAAGDSIPLPVKNLNEIYGVTTTTGQEYAVVAGKDA